MRDLFAPIALSLIGCSAEFEQVAEELELENNQLQNTVTTLQETLNQLQIELENTRSELATIQETSLAHSETLQQHESSISNLTTSLEDRPTTTEVESMIDTYVSSFTITIEQFDDLEIRTADLESAMGLLSVDVQGILSDISMLQESVLINSDAIVSVNSLLSTLDTDISAIEDDVMHLSSAGSIEAGTIAIWSGAIVDIPQGWLLCDGNDGTPDLQDRFVVGAGSQYGVSESGGSTTGSVSASTAKAQPCADNPPWTFCTHTGLSVVTSVSGSSSIPPYYALAYIMKE